MATDHKDPAPGSTASLRTANQQRVLDVLRAGPMSDAPDAGFTQAEIAQTTGLARATVSNIIRDLTDARLVDVTAGSGRRGSSVRLSPDAGVVAGIDFGHSHLAVAVGDLSGRILAEERRPLPAPLEHAAALALSSEIIASLDPGRGRLRSIALGLPAPVIAGTVRSTAIFPGWDGVSAQQAAEDVLGAPVHVENDANLGALAEHRRGVARPWDTSVFVKVSSGVGAGIIIGNRLHHGSAGAAGEIGHLTLDDRGPLCRCGSRGCLEAYAAVGSVRQLLAEQLPEASLDQIVDAAREGNVSAQRGLEDAGLHLGWGLAHIVNLLNPAVVVIGGDMARAGEFLLAPARVGLRRHALDAVAHTRVLASELGERASLIGAVLLAAENTQLTDQLNRPAAS